MADPGRQKQIGGVLHSWGRREPMGDILIQTTTNHLKEIMSFAGKWTEAQTILLSKVSQT